IRLIKCQAWIVLTCRCINRNWGSKIPGNFFRGCTSIGRYYRDRTKRMEALLDLHRVSWIRFGGIEAQYLQLSSVPGFVVARNWLTGLRERPPTHAPENSGGMATGVGRTEANGSTDGLAQCIPREAHADRFSSTPKPPGNRPAAEFDEPDAATSRNADFLIYGLAQNRTPFLRFGKRRMRHAQVPVIDVLRMRQKPATALNFIPTVHREQMPTLGVGSLYMPSVQCQILSAQIPFFNVHLAAELLHSRERIRM
ncbi:MAG: hypothetical protein ACRD3O_17050, partial [Terriglobia bacterium]